MKETASNSSKSLLIDADRFLLKNYPKFPERKDPCNLVMLKNMVMLAQLKYEDCHKGGNYRGKKGWFTWIRHRISGLHRAKDLEAEVSKAKNINDVSKLINGFLTNSKTRYHKHSFASFLLDELKKLNLEPWNKFEINPVKNRYNTKNVKATLNIESTSLDLARETTKQFKNEIMYNRLTPKAEEESSKDDRNSLSM